MEIRTRMCMSLDGYITTPDGLPVQLADPAFVRGESYGFAEFHRIDAREGARGLGRRGGDRLRRQRRHRARR